VGGTIKLVSLLDEAVERATTIVNQKNDEAIGFAATPEKKAQVTLDPQTRAAVARAVGIGAVKYADLSTERGKDYVFDFDRMLAFTGNTAPYLQYVRARINSIFAKGEVTLDRSSDWEISITDPKERALAMELLSFPDLVTQVAESLEFHRLANYLFGLATSFTSFYENCPVLKSAEPLRSSRLALCGLTGRTMALGLNLLGITVPERM
jgi:arginyl-tRNA synthetase